MIFVRLYLGAAVVLPVVLSTFAQTLAPVNQNDLVAHYEQYSGTRIVVEGEVVSGPEMTLMYLPRLSRDPAIPEGMLITLAKGVSKKPGVLEKRFMKALKKTGRVDAVLSGRFDGGQIEGGVIKHAVDFDLRSIVCSTSNSATAEIRKGYRGRTGTSMIDLKSRFLASKAPLTPPIVQCPEWPGRLRWLCRTTSRSVEIIASAFLIRTKITLST